MAEGQYSTDCSLVYELVELARQFDDFFLHCFVIEDARARDMLRIPASVQIVDLGRVTCGRELYLHPLRLWQRVSRSVRLGEWSAAVLDEPGVTSMLALVACWLAGMPAVALIRGDPAVGGGAFRYRQGARAALGQALRYFRVVVQWALALSVPVVTDSETVRDRLSQRGAVVHYVPAASISAAEVLPPGKPWHGADFGPMRLLFVGRLERIKDIETLIEAVHAASRTGREFSLRIVGTGDPGYTSLLRSRVRELGLESMIEFAGQAPHGARLYECYQRAHLLVLSSRSEGIPKVVIEAMAHGLPVVATAVGGLPGLVTPDIGILVAPGDATALSKALIIMYDSPAMVKSMGQAARRNAAGLLSESVSRELASLVASAAWPPRIRLAVLLGRGARV